ncbi:MAG: FHA domain-containing protein [Gammaproteobacteria bacterium]|nr:FHA domain-containing protein [Gammaproteobacteria bacterium]MDH5653622.1 FHA domain-containing protein [Gammaproteobacteria bacterium]
MDQTKLLQQQVNIQELRITGTLMTLGRARDNDITINDKSVSAHHAKIITYFNTSYIEDLGSTNGILLNGSPVHKHIIHDGDEIQIGSYLFIISKDPPAFFSR